GILGRIRVILRMIFGKEKGEERGIDGDFKRLDKLVDDFDEGEDLKGYGGKGVREFRNCEKVLIR
ncbi:hypothetical protein, partial [Staphylococcus epidermidis]|uniref:hypothetical protein n=1 Tax=Staphylococcus epidermidis TaxID=1282 RepID=UPI0037D9EB66